MARGGARPGAGRKKGVPNRATTKRMAEIKASGEMPLEYMLRVMRDKEQPSERRDEMAKCAAQYCHPRLASVEAQHSGNVLVTHEQALEALE